MYMFTFMHSSKHIQVFMSRLMELITADSASSRVPYDRKELALEYIVQVMCNDSITLILCSTFIYQLLVSFATYQLCHLPYLMAELYVNFDCGLYCTNVFENITKLLSKVHVHVHCVHGIQSIFMTLYMYMYMYIHCELFCMSIYNIICTVYMYMYSVHTYI